MRISLGLKLWSTNLDLAPQARELFDRGELDFIELFCVPDSFDATSGTWGATGIPCVVHAPHSMSGLNFAKAEMRSRNMRLAEESFRMADAMRARHVIFHPGTGGHVEESIAQARSLRDSRMLLENKPFLGLNGETCIGSTPEEIQAITTATGCGFCLDFGHAMAAARSHRVEAMAFVRRFAAMAPAMFHMTDGDSSSEMDRHDQYGKGSFPLQGFLELVPDGALVTDEAMRSSPGLGEYVDDRNWIRNLLAGAG